MRIEKVVRRGKEFAILPMDGLRKLVDAAEMLADVKAYDAAKGRLARGEDELDPAGDYGAPLSRGECGQGMAGASGDDPGGSRESVGGFAADDRGH
jgi:hypothetical protein